MQKDQYGFGIGVLGNMIVGYNHYSEVIFNDEVYIYIYTLRSLDMSDFGHSFYF